MTSPDTRRVQDLHRVYFYYPYRGNFQSGVWDLNLFLARNLNDIPISVHSWMNRLPFFLFTIDNENFQMCTMFITQTRTQYMYMAQASTSPYRYTEWILVVPVHVLIMSQLNCSVTWLFSAVIIINKCWVKVVV